MIVKKMCLLGIGAILMLALAVSLYFCYNSTVVSLEYQITPMLYSSRNEDNFQSVSISIPQVKMKNKEMERKVNNILHTRAVGYYMDSWDFEHLTVDSSYEVKRADTSILSVLFCGDAYVDQTAHPTTVRYAVNINLETGEVLKPADVVALGCVNVDFETQSFTQVEGVEYSTENYELLLSEFQENPLIYRDSEHTYDFYLTTDKIGILVGVSHPMGDVITLEGDLDEGARGDGSPLQKF